MARWPNGRMPFAFASDVVQPMRAIINAAIKAWNAPEKGLPVRVVARSAEPDFVMFTMNPVKDFGDPFSKSTANSSASQYLGRRGGTQLIFCSSSLVSTTKISTDIATAVVIHEIGHAFVLFHEQNREDRDSFVNIHWDNILPTAYSQFLIESHASDDHGAYDFKSVMHYHDQSYAVDTTKKTITPVNPLNTIAPSLDLSSGDIAAIKFLYRQITLQPPAITIDPPPITVAPPSFNVTVPAFTVNVPAITVTPPKIGTLQPPSITVNPPAITVPQKQIVAQPSPITADPPPITVTPPPVAI